MYFENCQIKSPTINFNTCLIRKLEIYKWKEGYLRFWHRDGEDETHTSKSKNFKILDQTMRMRHSGFKE